MKKIFVDLDGTLNNILEYYYKQVKKLSDKDIPDFKNIELKYYQLHKNIPSITIEEGKKLRNKIFATPGFFMNIPIFEGAKEVIQYLYNKYDVYILTAPWIYYDHCCTEKYLWIKKQLEFFDLTKVIFTLYKNLIKIDKDDFIIDDNPIHLERNDCKKITKNYLYNKDVCVDGRFDNWDEIPKLINILDGE